MKHLFLTVLILFAINAIAVIKEPFNKPKEKNSSIIKAKTFATNKRGLVLKLLEITNAKKQVEEILKTMTEILPKNAKQVFVDPLKPDEMIAQIVPVYERYLSVDDLKSIIQFYETPTGKKLLKAQPKILEDSMIVMKVYVQKKLKKSMNKNLKE